MRSLTKSLDSRTNLHFRTGDDFGILDSIQHVIFVGKRFIGNSDGLKHSKLLFAVVCLVTCILILVRTTSIDKSVSISVWITNRSNAI